jgi:DNA-directed RNA polymerase
MLSLEPDLLQVQHDLEDESRAIGQARYRNQRHAPWTDAFGPDEDEGALPPGRAMIRRAVKPTADAIAAFLEAGRKGTAGRRHVSFDLLRDFDPDPAALAYLTLRCGLQGATLRHRAQKAALMVSRAVRDHLQASAFSAANPRGAAGLQKSVAGRRVSAARQRAISHIHKAEGVALEWSEKQELALGLKLIEIAAEATGLFELELVSFVTGKTRRREKQISVTDTALEWLERQHDRCELLDPLPLPMVVPPRPWTNLTDGGYLTPPIGSRLVKSRSKPFLEELANVAMDDVYRAINTVQATRWRINSPLLDIITRVEADGGCLGGLPARDPELVPERLADADSNAACLQRWLGAAAQVHQRNAASRSARLALAQQLWVARKLADYPEIYFPHHCDWRGRVYPIPQAGPHPQGGDVARSLLEFSVGKPLGTEGARWLAIHLANLFGIDKVNFADRIAWVDQHRQHIVDSARDPIDGLRFWTTAKKPWSALAACLEWAGFLAEGASFISRLPIAVDGSNSGLQHLTALLRDSAAAPHVNLCPAESPGDIYAVVAARAQALVDASSAPEAAAWKNGKINRGIVKQPCMTFVYSVKSHGMADQVRSVLARLDREEAEAGRPPYLGGADNFTSANWLARQLFVLIGQAVPVAKTAMDWLQATAKLISTADFPIWWTTPAGLPVMQRYAESKSEIFETTFRGKRLQLRIDDDLTPGEGGDLLGVNGDRLMNAGKASNGIVPNFVQSLDAAHLMLTANAAREAGIVDLAVIHDSFGTHAADMDQLSAILRRTFVTMYAADPLGQFHDEVKRQLSNDQELISLLRPPPERGQFDLEQVMSAVYMFA